MEALVFLFPFAVSAIVDGFVVKVLWGWFVAPTFHLPVLTITKALGISLILMVPLYHHVEDDRPYGKQMLESILVPLILLVMGWVAHLFM